MKQTVEEAAREAIHKYYKCDGEYPCGERNYCEHFKGSNPAYDCGECGADEFNEGFIAGAEWQARQSPWISVKERLPENDDDYYIGLDTTMQPHGCDIVEFNPITNKFSDMYRIVNITHWMMIPKSPEETKNKNY